MLRNAVGCDGRTWYILLYEQDTSKVVSLLPQQYLSQILAVSGMRPSLLLANYNNDNIFCRIYWNFIFDWFNQFYLLCNSTYYYFFFSLSFLSDHTERDKIYWNRLWRWLVCCCSLSLESDRAWMPESQIYWLILNCVWTWNSTFSHCKPMSPL